MSGRAAKTQLTVCMYEVLLQLSSSRSVSTSIVTRAKIILMAFRKDDNQTIGRQLGFSGKTVGIWRRRWRDSFAALLRMQFTENASAFRRAIIECLSDAPRSGSPGKFNPEQIVGLIGIACEPPEKSDRPVTSWTGKELAQVEQKST